MAQTKSHWKAGKLRFYNAPMFVSSIKQTAAITASGTQVTSSALPVLQGPWYADSFSTDQGMHFHASWGGVISSSSQIWSVSLRYGTAKILTVRGNTSAASVNSTKVPFGGTFDGRIATYSTLSKVSARGVLKARWQNTQSTATYDLVQPAHDGTTGGSSHYCTTDINLKAASTIGWNIIITADTTKGEPYYAINHASMQFFD
jgi:hypothetical protein